MRLANMKGTVDEEESKRLESRRKRLEKIHEDKIRAEEMMKTQIARIEEDMRKLSNVYQNSIAEYERIVSLALNEISSGFIHFFVLRRPSG